MEYQHLPHKSPSFVGTPLVICYITMENHHFTMENHHRNSAFSHEKMVDFSIVSSLPEEEAMEAIWPFAGRTAGAM